MFELLIDWWHHTFNPHCIECNQCNNCIVLKELLNAERKNNQVIIQSLLERINPSKVIESKETKEYEPIKSTIPWSVRREMLEREDRIAAQKLKENLDIQSQTKNESVKEENAS